MKTMKTSIHFSLCLLASLALHSPLLINPASAQPASKSAASDISIAGTADKLMEQLKAAKKPKSDKWKLSLLPVGLQKNPQIDYTIVTEMTDSGKKLPTPAMDKPIYYYPHAIGQHDVGDSYGGTKDIPYDYLKKQLDNALASNGYRPVDDDHREPSQVLFFVWGMHNRIDPMPDPDSDDSDSGDSGDGSDATSMSDMGGDVSMTADDSDIMNLLGRAKTIGGQKFADEFATALSDQLQWAGNTDYESSGPLRRFATRDDDTEALVYEIFNDCYFLIVYSFDAEALKNNQKKLLWTTHISTTSQGVNFVQTLPIMITQGAYYFGRESDGIQIVRKNAYKSATVDMGELQVVNYLSDTTAASGTAAIKPTGTTTPSTTTTGTAK